jgi:mxaK protein
VESLKPRLPWFWWLALAFSLAGVSFTSFQWVRTLHRNQIMADPSDLIIQDDTPEPLQFAKAYQFAEHGEIQEAQRIYNGLRQIENPALRERVLYNLGTLYLQEAAKVWLVHGVKEYVRVSTLVDLAKENLRGSLRLNPANTNAQFNLEYAYRITPPPREKPKADFKGTKASIFATIPGIPGGGP